MTTNLSSNVTALSPDRAVPMSRLLIVDDEQVLRLALKLNLTRLGYSVEEASNIQEAKVLLGLCEDSSLDVAPIDLVLCDWRLGEENGIELIQEIAHSAARPIKPDILFMSAHASHQVALSAIHAGASDFIAKPFETAELVFRVKKLLEERAVRIRLRNLETLSLEHEDQLGGLVGRTPEMKSLFQLIRRVAPSQSKLLITGESGTGKELVARVIHQLSGHPESPFIALNCAALPEHLIESELFGHVKGAFTHAQKDRRGLIEEANGGTLFLDEIGELPLALQAKLLRVLQEGEVRRVGSNEARQLTVRFIAATLKDLDHEVQVGRFRRDLYYRLNVIPIEIPPLRQRLSDIPALVTVSIKRLAKRLEIDPPQISQQVLSLFQGYDWPGNVREMENALEHAMVLCDRKTIEIQDLPRALHSIRQRDDDSSVSSPPKLLSHPQSIRDLDDLSIKRHTQVLEQSLILEALRRAEGIKTQAAKSLEISTKTLLYKLRDFQIDHE